MQVTEHILQNEQYQFLFSVEEVNKLVNAGMPFRDAYKKIGMDIEQGKFTYTTDLHHTHEGSIGNLCNAQISERMQTVEASFGFAKVKEALDLLIG
jgi:argininosuccinate lyase